MPKKSVDPAIEFQARMMAATKQADPAYICEAFSRLSDPDGHYECFGDTVGGASACYIACTGSPSDRKDLIARLKEDARALELARKGLWDAPSDVSALIASVFEISLPEQRLDTLEILDIEASEAEDVRRVLREIAGRQLTAKETKLIRKTEAGDHWA